MKRRVFNELLAYWSFGLFGVLRFYPRRATPIIGLGLDGKYQDMRGKAAAEE